MTLSDQVATTGQDGRVTERQPGRPKRRTFTKAYKEGPAHAPMSWPLLATPTAR